MSNRGFTVKKRRPRWIGVLSMLLCCATFLALPGCGQKGPLYLPAPSQEPVTDGNASREKNRKDRDLSTDPIDPQ